MKHSITKALNESFEVNPSNPFFVCFFQLLWNLEEKQQPCIKWKCHDTALLIIYKSYFSWTVSFIFTDLYTFFFCWAIHLQKTIKMQYWSTVISLCGVFELMLNFFLVMSHQFFICYSSYRLIFIKMQMNELHIKCVFMTKSTKAGLQLGFGKLHHW